MEEIVTKRQRRKEKRLAVVLVQVLHGRDRRFSMLIRHLLLLGVEARIVVKAITGLRMRQRLARNQPPPRQALVVLLLLLRAQRQIWMRLSRTGRLKVKHRRRYHQHL